ncbi:LysR family transcriptional regulator [Bacillus sp. AFS041924]|uniref:LysR family transcriptional regulator n=1 Tax=Bacillus sp. AFS041924 TaxID=2033503 RepID=UPI000BFD093A|nr:LysR family transcriptional regulator [Bacillus sp. AFS041924]PGS55848.1 LysR family transcriptional regulator [Bacillus sp. AFS041924]
MEIRHLITFKSIVDMGGFSRAAVHLGYAQSTITAHIQALEQELGVPLFDRIGKKVHLTEVGENFLVHAIEMIQLYTKAKDVFQMENEEVSTLKIGAPESLTIYRLPQIIQAFRSQNPKVNIMMKSASCWELQDELRRGDLDIGFFLQAPQTDSDLYMETLIEEPLVILLPPSSNARTLSTFILNENENIILTEQGSYRDYFEAFLRSKGIATESGMEFWSVEAIKQCVMCGLGISMLPLVTVQNEMKQQKLQVINWDTNLGNVSTIMSWHKNRWQSRAARKFMEVVREQSTEWETSIK